MPPGPDTPDVVVVGAGPTGLMAATLLRRCGVSVRVFDKTAQQAHESRVRGTRQIVRAPAEHRPRRHLHGARPDRVRRPDFRRLVFRVYGPSRRVPQALFLIRPDGYVAYRAADLGLTGVRAFRQSLSPTPAR